MRYERERGICDLLRVELETGEVGFAGDQRCGGNRGLRPIGDIPPAEFEAQYCQQAEVA